MCDSSVWPPLTAQVSEANQAGLKKFPALFEQAVGAPSPGFATGRMAALQSLEAGVTFAGHDAQLGSRPELPRLSSLV